MKFDLNEQIDCAVRERGAKSHLIELEKDIQQKNRWLTMTTSIAASFLILLTIGLDIKLSGDIREIGYAFNPVAGQSGGSEITALMEDKQIKEALDQIESARIALSNEMQNPSYDDEAYIVQLEMDAQELDLLEAVCYMRQGKYFKAKICLKDIVDGKGSYSSEAEELLNSL